MCHSSEVGSDSDCLTPAHAHAQRVTDLPGNCNNGAASLRGNSGDDAPMTRSWWGWGDTAHALSDDECRGLGAALPDPPADPLPIPRIEDLDLRAPRIAPPVSLAHLCSTHAADSAAHTHGKAYRDVIRALHGDLETRPTWSRDRPPSRTSSTS